MDSKNQTLTPSPPASSIIRPQTASLSSLRLPPIMTRGPLLQVLVQAPLQQVRPVSHRPTWKYVFVFQTRMTRLTRLRIPKVKLIYSMVKTFKL